MNLLKTMVALGIGLAACSHVSSASAQATVECHSINYKYTECQAPLRAPQLIHQISNSSCIVNYSWGFNPATRRIWVSDGCSGVFADSSGYHHGRSDTHDKGARGYNDRGNDTGALVVGALAALMIEGALDDDKSSKHTSSKHTTSNYYHSAPRKRDTSQDVDTSIKKFDDEGNPNYDTEGGYIGCHGVGCLVDNPDAE